MCSRSWCFLIVWSPGEPRPYLDTSGRPVPDSISEKIRVDINGVAQGMFIKSRRASHPVLLYLHGGIPDYFLTGRYPTGLDEHFTMVWWDQRGSGLSYRAGMSPASASAEQLVSDTVAVTQYGQGLLHVRPLGAQPALRGAREDLPNHARGRAHRRDASRGSGVNVTGSSRPAPAAHRAACRAGMGAASTGAPPPPVPRAPPWRRRR